jgi:uncharacterized membrane protein YfcA
MTAVLLGFLIAVAIGVTGVGGGVVTAPVLILFLGIPPLEAVTVSLLFAAAVKMLVAPAYLWRGQVDFRILGRLLAGGLPGVLAGSLLIEKLSTSHQSALLTSVLGVTIAVTAAFNLWRLWWCQHNSCVAKDRSAWLPLVALPIGAEVGFSSAGAGALGTLALMNLTPLAAATIIGTDICFGLGLSLVGGGVHWSLAHATPEILKPLLIGGMLGGVAGVQLSGALPARPLRAVLCLWLMFVGLQLCWRAL